MFVLFLSFKDLRHNFCVPFTINKVGKDPYIFLIFLHGEELPRTNVLHFKKQASEINSINNFSLKNPISVVFDNMRKY